MSYSIQSPKANQTQSRESATGRGMEPMMTECAAEIEDQRIVAKRLFDALCAAYPDKYITLIQLRDMADAPPAPDVTRLRSGLRT